MNALEVANMFAVNRVIGETAESCRGQFKYTRKLKIINPAFLPGPVFRLNLATGKMEQVALTKGDTKE